jgi:hypothetical protein
MTALQVAVAAVAVVAVLWWGRSYRSTTVTAVAVMVAQVVTTAQLHNYNRLN